MFIELVLIGNNTSCSKFSRMSIANCHYKSNLLSPCSTSPQTLVASIIINPD